MASFSKEFVMTRTMKNISTIKDGEVCLTPEEQHFGFPWSFKISRRDNYSQVFIQSRVPFTAEQTIQVEFQLKLLTLTGESFFGASGICTFRAESWCYGYHDFLLWEKMEKEFVVDDAVVIEVCAKIIDTSGFEKKEKLRSFDESMKEFSDVVLIVKDVKFYVLKTFLAAQSNYFKAMLLGEFKEKNCSEVTLASIDPNDFQNFLEALYGHSQAITDATVEGVLHLADMFDSKSVTQTCEDYLIRVRGSKMTLKKKLQLADRYRLKNLKKNCYYNLEI